MLQIDIVGIDNSTGGLILEVGGRPNNGHSFAATLEDVHWKVKPNIGVRHIEAITWKDISGSTDVFSSSPPREQNANKTHWKARVNSNANFSVYVYTIRWVKDVGGSTHDFDPIISIKPSTLHNILMFVLLLSGAALGLLSAKLFYRRKSIK